MERYENFDGDLSPFGWWAYYSHVALQDVIGGRHLYISPRLSILEDSTLTTASLVRASKAMDITNIVRASVAALLLALVLVRPLVRKRPAWCSAFAPESLYSGAAPRLLKKSWTFWTVYLS